MSKARVLIPDGLHLSCKEDRIWRLDWSEQDHNLMKMEKSLHCVEGLVTGKR